VARALARATLRERAVERFGAGRPAVAQRVRECASLPGVEAAGVRGELNLERERVAHRGVERGVLFGSNRAKPVAAASPPVPTREQPVEQIVRRSIDDDLRQVLAAHEIHVVDA